MNDETTTIESIIKNENVLKTIKEVKKDYNSKSRNENVESTEKEKIEYVLGSLSTYYQNVFANAFKDSSKSLVIYSQNKSDSFKDHLFEVYHWLKHLYLSDHLFDEPSMDLKNTPHNNKYLYQTNNIIRYLLQKLYVEPLVSNIERNYFHELLNLNLLPISIYSLLDEINNDRMVFYESDCESIRENFHFSFSNKTNCVYYFSYCNHTDVYSYHYHLDKLFLQFKQSVNFTCSSMEDSTLKLEYLNRIRAILLELISQFQKVHSFKLNKPYEIPYHMRKTTLLIFQQLTAELFGDDEIAKAKIYLFNFQDLQYQIANQALSFIESKIKMLRFVIKNRLKITQPFPSSNKTNLIEKLKIKLTVPQLGFFLRMIIEEKGILDVNNKAAFFRKVTTAISALKQNDISAISLNDKAKNPTEKTIEFWIEKLTHLLQFAKQLRDKMAR
jgi:hypothetical protein